MNVTRMSVQTLRANPDNPRVIRDDKFKKLVQSLRDFPAMLELRPIVVNAQHVVLGGNMRLRACQEAGLQEVPVIIAHTLTPEQEREFIIKDNVSFGEWDWDVLANKWDVDALASWGMDIPTFPDDKDHFADTAPELEGVRYQVIVDCKSDIEQGNIASELEQRGFSCRLLTL